MTTPKFADAFLEGSCDSHVHVYGPEERFPILANTNYMPPERSTVEDLLAVMYGYGIARAVIVHALPAGPDNACTYDALRRFPDRLRAVGLLDTEVSDQRLDELTDAGFRGVRINLLKQGGKKLYRGGMTLDDLRALAPRLSERGWHAQIWAAGADLPELSKEIETLPLDFVVDHMGRSLAADGVSAPGFQHLLRLLDTGRYWCKISGADRNTSSGAPFADIAPFQEALVAANPERIVWGTDWPHVNHSPATMPKTDDLVALFLATVSDAGARRRILVDNPATLYGF